MGTTSLLTSASVVVGTTYMGFLYDTKNHQYVGLDPSGQWFYANQDTLVGSMCWNLVVEDNNSVTISTVQNGTVAYLSWTDQTGAVELYSSYTPMSISWTSANTFTLMDVPDQQYFGILPGTNNELYVQSVILPGDNFQFIVVTYP